MKLIITGSCGHIGSYVAENVFKIPKIKKTILVDNLKSNRHGPLFNQQKKNNLEKPDIILHVRPTTPLRTLKIFNRGIKYFIKMKNFTSMRSVYKSNQTPYKIFKLKKNSLKGFFPKFKNEYYNLPRQKFTETYIPNGYIDIVKPSIIRKNKFKC